MGLAEKRKAEEIKKDSLPVWESKLNELAGYPIKLEFDWNTWTAYDEYPLSRLEYVYEDIEGFVKSICADDLGKEALKGALSTIHLTNTDQDSEMKMELKDKVLYLTERLAGSSFNNHRTNQLIEYVEKQL